MRKRFRLSQIVVFFFGGYGAIPPMNAEAAGQGAHFHFRCRIPGFCHRLIRLAFHSTRLKEHEPYELWDLVGTSYRGRLAKELFQRKCHRSHVERQRWPFEPQPASCIYERQQNKS